jgi:uncharacterized membrane protein YdjX (TVP38/TMEM64 family)
MAHPGAETESQAHARSSLVRWALAAVAIVALLVVGRELGRYLPQFVGWVNGLGVWGPVVFVLGYVVSVVAFIPASVLTLSAGAIFGVWKGTLFAFLGASIGSIAAFLVSRHAARQSIEQRIQGDERFAAIDRAVENEGLKITFLLRLSPIFPFNLLNYALGLTRVRLADYVLASFGMLPGTLLYVYSGKVAGDVATAAGGAAVSRGTGYYAFLALGFAATLAVTIAVTRIARRALRDATGQ